MICLFRPPALSIKSRPPQPPTTLSIATSGIPPSLLIASDRFSRPHAGPDSPASASRPSPLPREPPPCKSARLASRLHLLQSFPLERVTVRAPNTDTRTLGKSVRRQDWIQTPESPSSLQPDKCPHFTGLAGSNLSPAPRSFGRHQPAFLTLPWFW